MAPTHPVPRSRAEWAEILDAIQAEVARTLQLTPSSCRNWKPMSRPILFAPLSKSLIAT